VIYHWCPSRDWSANDQAYRAESLTEEGFIHFSFRAQVERTATDLNQGDSGLVLLCVDETGLPVVIEDSYGIGEEFPHLYAALPAFAVVAAVPFPCEPDGSFRFPPGAPEPDDRRSG
jgi:uncharacterized protein (DUF952 family)